MTPTIVVQGGSPLSLWTFLVSAFIPAVIAAAVSLWISNRNLRADRRFRREDREHERAYRWIGERRRLYASLIRATDEVVRHMFEGTAFALRDHSGMTQIEYDRRIAAYEERWQRAIIAAISAIDEIRLVTESGEKVEEYLGPLGECVDRARALFLRGEPIRSSAWAELRKEFRDATLDFQNWARQDLGVERPVETGDGNPAAWHRDTSGLFLPIRAERKRRRWWWWRTGRRSQ